MLNKLFSFVLALLFPLWGYADTAPVYHATHDTQSVNETYIEVNGASLFCKTMGRGSPLIVLHGGPGFSHDHLLPLSKLARDNFLIFYDQRGGGKSTGEITPETINLGTFIDDLDAIRKAYKLDKIAILGHSWGGLLAMHYAIAHPEHVEKVILSNSCPATAEGYAAFLQEYQKRLAPYQDELKKLENSQAFASGDLSAISEYCRIIFKTYFYDPDKIDQMNLNMTSQAAMNLFKIFAILQQNVLLKPYDITHDLKLLHIPALIIHGDFDPIPVSCAENIHDSFENAEYILIKNCGHFPFVEQPEAFFAPVRDFLER